MESLLLTNVRPWGGPASDILIERARITSVTPAGAGAMPGASESSPVAAGTAAPEPGPSVNDAARVDGRGLLALPGLINAHAHVDKSWWGRPWASYGGEPGIQGRIAYERAQRGTYGIPSADVSAAVLREFLRHGTAAARTHVDVDLGVGLTGIDAVRAAAAELGGAIELEIVAFPQDGVIRRPGVLDLLDRAAQAGAGCIGGLDPASIDRDPVAQLDGLFRIAERRGVGLDIHVHDGGELGAFQFELIIDRTLRTGLAGKVNVSHGFALGELPPARQEQILDGLAEAGISWTTVAPVRSAPLPWRGMRTRGIGLGLGTDGIRDFWSPYGDGDMLRIALGFAQLHGLRLDEDLVMAVRLASSEAAGYVHRGVSDLAAGAPGDVVLVDAENVPDALMRVPRRELVISAGRVVVRDGEVLV